MKLGEVVMKPPNILFYAPFGRGKTALMLTLGERLVVLDFDEGLRTGQTFKDKWHGERVKAEVKECYDDLPESAKAFKIGMSYLKSFYQEVKKGTFAYQAIGVDSLSKLVEGATRQTLYENGHLGRGPTQPEWGTIFRRIQEFMLWLRAIPVVTIVTAHTRLKAMEDSQEEEALTIGIPGRQLPEILPGYFDEVWFGQVVTGEGGKPKYVVRSETSKYIRTRTRSNLADGTPHEVGLVEMLKMCGYVFPDRKVETEKERPNAKS